MSREMVYSGNPWIGDIPSSWGVERIKTIFKERTELSEDGSETLLSVSEYYGVANRSERVSEGEFVSRAETLVGYKKCYVGDLVSNIMLAWKGSMGITEIDGIVSPAYCVYEPSPRIYPKYYHYLFRTSLYTSIFRLYSKGIIDSRLGLYSPYFFDISAIIPSLPEQQKIASFLDRKCAEIDEMIALQEKIVEELKAYKQSVITEAVTKGLNPDAPMKDSGIEWIGEIPEHWKQCKIKNGLEINPIQSHRLEENTEVSYMPMECLRNGVIEKRTALYRNLPSLTEFSEGDIVMAKVTPCFENGNIAIASDLTNGVGFGSSEVFVFRCYDNTLPSYAFYYLQSSYVKARGVSSMTGTGGLKRINPHYFCDTTMLLPTLLEQQEIAEYLDTQCKEIDNLILIKISKIDSLKEYKKSIIYEYVTGKKEVTE